MSEELFQRAFYIKLGKGGIWEKTSIEQGKMIIGWHWLSVDEINSRDWDGFKRKHPWRDEKPGSVTSDINMLRRIVESISGDDIWITFHESYLYWCRVGEPGILGNEETRYRMVAGKWNRENIHGKRLIINEIPGRIAKYQMFRGAVCQIKSEDFDNLFRLINDQPSPEYFAVQAAHEVLINEVEKGIKRLHPKDFEILVDLVFSKTWQRVSVVGEVMKGVDIELRDQVTGEAYQVQVKSAAGREEFIEYASTYGEVKDDFRKLFFVVHSPRANLLKYEHDQQEVELILPSRFSRLVVEAGLTRWLLKKIR